MLMGEGVIAGNVVEKMPVYFIQCLAYSPIRSNLMTVFGDFVRRENKDSTVDLICTKCFRTVASAKNDAAFEEAKRLHTCEPLIGFHWRPLRSEGRSRKEQAK